MICMWKIIDDGNFTFKFLSNNKRYGKKEKNRKGKKFVEFGMSHGVFFTIRFKRKK